MKNTQDQSIELLKKKILNGPLKISELLRHEVISYECYSAFTENGKNHLEHKDGETSILERWLAWKDQPKLLEVLQNLRGSIHDHHEELSSDRHQEGHRSAGETLSCSDIRDQLLSMPDQDIVVSDIDIPSIPHFQRWLLFAM